MYVWVSGGLVAKDARFDTGPGHVHELDITAAVRAWHEGKLANNGLALKGARGTFASSEWYVPTSRPVLLVDHGPKGSTPTGLPELKPAPKDIELDAVSATPDAGAAKGEYAVVCVGQNANCNLVGKSADTYVKEAVLRYPGAWGWYDMLRVGGRAGDVARTILYFDLAEIPKNASIKQATLVLSLTPYTNREVTNYRYGAFLLKLPDAPGWTAEATLAERKAATPWPAGGLLAASGEKPLALGKVTMKDAEVRGQKVKVPATIEFDLTGAVRAWVSGKAPNCGVVLDNRIEGGAYDIYSSRSFKAELRPYLQITCSPTVERMAERTEDKCVLPTGDYWVEPMRELHKQFKGKKGILAQYGDSITVTQAYLEPHFWQKTVTAANITPEVQKEMDVVTAYADRQCWRKWKGSEWGNTGQKTSEWFLDRVDGCQKLMTPECGVILFGTNDLGGICPPVYTENMAAAIRRIMADGTVPMLTTVPPASGRDWMCPDYFAAHVAMARFFKIPMIDFYGETMKRRPDDWDGRLQKFKDNKELSTIISGDGTHPSFPKKWSMDWSEEALSNSGYTLRNYMSLRMYSQVISKVFLAEKKEGQ